MVFRQRVDLKLQKLVKLLKFCFILSTIKQTLESYSNLTAGLRSEDGNVSYLRASSAWTGVWAESDIYFNYCKYGGNLQYVPITMNDVITER